MLYHHPVSPSSAPSSSVYLGRVSVVSCLATLAALCVASPIGHQGLVKPSSRAVVFSLGSLKDLAGGFCVIYVLLACTARQGKATLFI